MDKWGPIRLKNPCYSKMSKEETDQKEEYTWKSFLATRVRSYFSFYPLVLIGGIPSDFPTEEKWYKFCLFCKTDINILILVFVLLQEVKHPAQTPAMV